MAANVNNYVKAGNAAVRKAVLARKALAENKPRYDEMAMEAVTQRAKDNANIATNNAKTAKMKMDIEAGMERQQIGLDEDKYIRGQQKQARMTGLLAGGAAILGVSAIEGSKPEEENIELKLQQQQLDYWEKRTAQLQAQAQGSGNGAPPEYPTLKDLPEYPTDPNTSNNTSSNTDSSGGGSSSTVSGAVDPAKVFSYLTKEKGLSRNKALGLMANIERESSFRPSVASGDDGGAGGLFQWKGGRQTETVRQLVQSGNWKGQIDYALSEPGEPYSSTFQNTTFNSPQAAADGWMTHWERPADKTAGSKKHTTFLSRYNF